MYELTDLPRALSRASIWFPEEDPILEAQLATLLSLLEDVPLSEEALEGFLIVCSRFVDDRGNHRTTELASVFRTHTRAGRHALIASLEHMARWVGGVEAYKRDYPVTIIPPRPAFPQLKILGIETIADRLFRVLDSQSRVRGTRESVEDFVKRTGRLPPVPRQRHPVRRSKPHYHWCSYERWNDPGKTRDMLQILPSWSDCGLRATIRTARIQRSAFVTFNGDRHDPEDSSLHFYQYFYEPLAQDHPPQGGGGTQIGLEGSPRVELLERWNGSAWRTV